MPDETRREHFDRLERAALDGIGASVADTRWLCEQVVELEMELRHVGSALLTLQHSVKAIATDRTPS